MNIKVELEVKEKRVYTISIRLYDDNDEYVGICNVGIPTNNTKLLAAARAYGEDFQTAALEFLDYPREEQFTQKGMFSSEDVVYIDRIEIIPTARGNRYGYGLIERVIELFCGNPDTSIILVIDRGSEFDLTEWYTEFGFHKLTDMCMRYQCTT